MEVKLRQQEDVILAMPYAIASTRLKLIAEMDKEEKNSLEKAKSGHKPAPQAPRQGHVRIPTVNSLKISG